MLYSIFYHTCTFLSFLKYLCGLINHQLRFNYTQTCFFIHMNFTYTSYMFSYRPISQMHSIHFSSHFIKSHSIFFNKILLQLHIPSLHIFFIYDFYFTYALSTFVSTAGAFVFYTKEWHFTCFTSLPLLTSCNIFITSSFLSSSYCMRSFY